MTQVSNDTIKKLQEFSHGASKLGTEEDKSVDSIHVKSKNKYNIGTSSSL